MLQKLHPRRGGFTLVEIMIVVAIIALLATIAVPNFMRARMRSQATACKQDLRIIDAAVDQWAMEKNKKNGDAVTVMELAAYVKDGTTMYTVLKAGAPVDTLGSAIVIPPVGTIVKVPDTTKTATTEVADSAFWSPYN